LLPRLDDEDAGGKSTNTSHGIGRGASGLRTALFLWRYGYGLAEPESRLRMVAAGTVDSARWTSSRSQVKRSRRAMILYMKGSPRPRVRKYVRKYSRVSTFGAFQTFS
jgi:hypothetical protein